MTTPSRTIEVRADSNAMNHDNVPGSKFESITIDKEGDNHKRNWPFDNTDHAENANTTGHSSDKWSQGRSRSRSDGPERHISYNEADLQRVDHPPSQTFLEHRLSFNESERHPVPTTADGHFTAEHHIHFNPDDLQRVNHPPSQPFLEHRRTHYHAEVHPTNIILEDAEPHIHFKEEDVKRVDHPPSPRFLEHRHSLDHAEAPITEDGHFAEPHIHFKEADLKRVDHPPSPRFLEHRRSYDHSELHPIATTADGHFTAEPHIHFNEADIQRVEHPPSQPFLEHRRLHYHAEVHPTANDLISDELEK